MLSKIGTGELIVIFLVALFMVGPDRLPKLAKSFGKAAANFKHYMNDVTKELRESDADFKEVADELKKAKKEISDTFKDTGSAVKKTIEGAEKEACLPAAKAEAPKSESEAHAGQKAEEKKAE